MDERGGATPKQQQPSASNQAESSANVFNFDDDEMKMMFCSYEEYAGLHIAVREKNLALAEALLNSGSSVNRRHFGGKTPLHIAVDGDSAEMVGLLLDHNPLINVECYSGKTALCKAVEKNELRFVRLFTDKIKLMDDKSALINVNSAHGRTPLMMAAQKGFIDVMKLLIDAGADVNQFSENERTAAHLAIIFNKLECLKFLYAQMSEEVKAKKCSDEYTCLQHTVVFNEWCEYNFLEYLFDMGEDPNYCMAPFLKTSSSVSVHCLDSGALCTCLQILESQISVLTSSILYEKSRQFCKVLQGCGRVKSIYVSEVLQRGANVNPESPHDLSPLNAAVYSGKLDMVKMFLRLGANPNYPNNMGCNKCAFTLHTAFANPAILVELLKAGGDIRPCFNHEAQLCPADFDIISHVNCLNMIVNIFSGKELTLLYTLNEEMGYSTILISDDPNAELENSFKTHPTFSDCQCSELVADIDSMSLKHLCRIKVVQLLLKANNNAPIQQCLSNASFPKRLADFLMYK